MYKLINDVIIIGGACVQNNFSFVFNGLSRVNPATMSKCVLMQRDLNYFLGKGGKKIKEFFLLSTLCFQSVRRSIERHC